MPLTTTVRIELCRRACVRGSCHYHRHGRQAAYTQAAEIRGEREIYSESIAAIESVLQLPTTEQGSCWGDQQ